MLLFSFSVAAAPAPTKPGLAVAFTNVAVREQKDWTTLPNFALYVDEKDSATPLLAPGPFMAVLEGFVNVDLRSEYSFSADLNGSLRLEINGHLVFDLALTNGRTPLSSAIRLHKGANAVKAILGAPRHGAAYLRLGWSEKGTNTVPIPASALSHKPSPQLEQSAQAALGRELFIEYRCAQCHAPGGSDAMDAPALAEIGSRRNAEWMARWILDPQAQREGARMPKMLHGASAAAEAAHIAAYLARPGNAGLATNAFETSVSGGKLLFERLHCHACHELNGPAEPPKVSLRDVAQKFPWGALERFLLNPAAHYGSIRMPDFKLSQAEAGELASYLRKSAGVGSTSPPLGAGQADVEKGKHLVQTLGCLNCHGLNVENKYAAPKIEALKNDRGCLSADGKEGGKAPRYQLSNEERAALQSLGPVELASLSRHAPMEYALRQTRLLNCNACHGQMEGIPGVELLGGKLKPEWVGRLLAGELPYKPRAETHPGGEPWMEARMPAFKAYGAKLAAGLAALHGYPPKTPAEAPLDETMAELGRKLVGKDGGFSCISCHGVRTLPAMEVFEAEGINLQWSAERLLVDYYRRWMRHPLAIDPHTKMPTYFEDGQSPLTEMLEGDAEKQMDAMWHYLRLGDKMPLPATEPITQ